MKRFWDKIVEFMSIPQTRLDCLEGQVHRLRLRQEIGRLRRECGEFNATLAREVETNMLLSSTLATIDGTIASEERNEDIHCECAQMCRVNHTAEQMVAAHHKDCPHKNDMVRVVQVSDGGNSYYDTDIIGTLATLAETDNDDIYIVQFMEMRLHDYEALPEFTGF